jgi:hypothetical protein
MLVNFNESDPNTRHELLQNSNKTMQNRTLAHHRSHELDFASIMDSEVFGTDRTLA